ncbi:protein phosphatase 2C domain-containing protein [Bacillus sp. EAC]|uniref:protein phosphatase 2C domain-containing protein n=1 Tax=Bacillus sp. EAC TaxID=1978338 RepID=UPI000B450B60|nr:protein phosphatase 2C domain-containing protein [Bacillus sp. EAC]
MNKKVRDFSWVGSQGSFVDKPDVITLNNVVLGRYGGNSKAGQYKNEDGCLVWSNESEDWEFIMLLDAHNTAKSAEIVLKQFDKYKLEIKSLLSTLTNFYSYKNLEEKVLNIFQEKAFIEECRNTQGETACLIIVRKDKYIWWFSIGDCILYLYHPELSALGQYQLNQRQFFEWVGQVNTFEQSVPCFSSGIKELRKGINHILLTTDGLIECPNDPFSNPKDIFKAFLDKSDERNVQSLLLKIQEENVRDSTTIISWKVNSLKEASMPSNL